MKLCRIEQAPFVHSSDNAYNFFVFLRISDEYDHDGGYDDHHEDDYGNDDHHEDDYGYEDRHGYGHKGSCEMHITFT